MKRYIMGIDPGKKSGGIALICYDSSDDYYTQKLDLTEKDIIDFISYFSKNKLILKCYLENVRSNAGGCRTPQRAFDFGTNFGFLRGIIITLNIPLETVTPTKWQKKLGCLTGGNKNISKSKAQELFPQAKITHSIADALLIAEYGKRIEKGI